MEVTKQIEEESEEQQGVYQRPLSSPVLGSFNKGMDNLNSLLSWVNCNQGKSMEELRHLLLCTTLELETTRLEALEEIRRREDQLKHLQHLLSVAIRERDEARDKFQSLLREKLQQQQQEEEIGPLSGNSSINDEYGRVDSSTGISSDGEESIVSPPLPPPPTPTVKLVAGKPLPEKGKLLEAVMKAGPLLQTLLLTGPLPQWQHQPPPLDSLEIPLVAVHSASGPPHFHHENGGVAVPCEGSDPSTNTKYQRITLH